MRPSARIRVIRCTRPFAIMRFLSTRSGSSPCEPSLRPLVFRLGLRQRWVLLPALVLVGISANYAATEPAHEESVIRGLDRAEMDRETRLTGYSVTERYTLHNGRFQTAAERTVATVYSKGAGKTYQTLSKSGSSTLQSSVLDKLLLDEAAMSRGDSRQQALITSANYMMKLVGEESLGGRACDILEIVPRTKSPHLLKGRVWVDAGDQSLVRVEGTPVASASFWAGRPAIVRDYEKVDGFSVAKISHALSESLLLGKTELTIEYTGYAITGTAK